ncbi:MAG TPA: alpha/beta hydrolase [Solirubrobacteraceae bacterium]|nr:alpha/beta hydrolase [Solirubrobacteraceae bacterium]
MSSRSGIVDRLGGRTRIYWESTGTGDPVLLIHGLGLSGGAWWRTVDALAGAMRVITFDHRGIGQSESLTYAYTTEAMADDAVSILDDLEIDRVHLYGFSLGGMVAQQIALRNPTRVQSLVLGATHPGGRHAAFPESEVVAFFRRRATMPSEEAAWASVPYNYGPRSRAEQVDRIAEDIERRLANPFNEQAYRGQLLAASLHNCYRRLERIRTPTLVVHGARDRIIPAANAHMIAERVPGAQLKILEDAGHLYPTEEAAVDGAIGEFFAAHG